MLAIKQRIKKAIEERKPEGYQARLKIYNEIAKQIKDEIKASNLSNDKKTQQIDDINHAITSIEAEYAMIDKLSANKVNQSKKSEVNNYHINQNSEEPSTYDHNSEKSENTDDTTINPIVDSFVKAEKKLYYERNRERYYLAAKIFLIFIGAFIISLFIASFFIKNKHYSASYIEHQKAIKKANKNFNPDNKYNERLLADGSTINTIIPKFTHRITKNTDNTSSLNIKPKNLVIYKALNPATNQEDRSLVNTIHWSALRYENKLTDDKTYAIKAIIHIPYKIDIQLILSPNKEADESAYVMEIAFLTNNKNPIKIKKLDQFIIKQDFDAPEVNLTSTNLVQIGDNLFAYNFKNIQPFLNNDLKSLELAPWFAIKFTDNNNISYNLTFAKDNKANIIFQEIIEKWLGKTYSSNALSSK